jgi:flagellar protein FlaF
MLADASRNAAPREFEADLLLEAASQLKAAQAGHPNLSAIADALAHNRDLWTVLLHSISNADNPLPTEIRQNVANLRLFVVRQTLAMMSDPRPERLDPLISINCELAAGLRGQI